MEGVRRRKVPFQETQESSFPTLSAEGTPPEAQSARRYYPICTSCSKPASRIYKSYTPTLIALVRCSDRHCKSVVDPYGDEEYRPGSKNKKWKSTEDAANRGIHISGSWMDLILVKPRAYRHFLYNLPFLLPSPEQQSSEQKNVKDHPEADETSFDHNEIKAWKTVAKRFIALSLIDGYLRWFYLCTYSIHSFSSMSSSSSSSSPSSPYYSLPHLLGGLSRAIKHRLRSFSDFNLPFPINEIGMTEVMLTSYVMVWLGTLLETLAMYSTVTLLSFLYVTLSRKFSWTSTTCRTGGTQDEQFENDGDFSAQEDTEDEEMSSDFDLPGPVDVPPQDMLLVDLYRPSLIPNALLLSSLTTLLLLSIILLWESKLPRPDSSHLTSYSSSDHPESGFQIFLPHWLRSTFGLNTQQFDENLKAIGVAFSTDFAVRTLLGGLNAGVSLAVIHPKSPILTTSLLLLGWLVSYNVRTQYTLLPSDVGPGGATAGGHRWSWEAEAAREWYCAAPS
ncbi:unnamed protein product [Sympodiomycopsis kandeliae]